MGVYIKGTEMPTNCESCPCKTADAFGGLGCRATGYIPLREANQDRPNWCPLVPVPPHGRLIDASESIRVEFYDEEHEDWTRHDMTIDDLLSQSWVDADAPTIIPAEPSEEQRAYEAQVEAAQYCEMYEPSYDPETGAL